MNRLQTIHMKCQDFSMKNNNNKYLKGLSAVAVIGALRVLKENRNMDLKFTSGKTVSSWNRTNAYPWPFRC